MSDRELLEAAAKAAGMVLTWEGPDHDQPQTLCKGAWNPRAYDGDALRLAVTLQIDVKHYGDHVVAWFDGGYIGTGRIPYDGDPFAATRLAIVRAAAETAREKGAEG